jgi:hypothetical protein
MTEAAVLSKTIDAFETVLKRVPVTQDTAVFLREVQNTLTQLRPELPVYRNFELRPCFQTVLTNLSEIKQRPDLYQGRPHLHLPMKPNRLWNRLDISGTTVSIPNMALGYKGQTVGSWTDVRCHLYIGACETKSEFRKGFFLPSSPSEVLQRFPKLSDSVLDLSVMDPNGFDLVFDGQIEDVSSLPICICLKYTAMWASNAEDPSKGGELIYR